MIGETISHYRILEKLGGGGMGVVYRAEDLKLKRQVALKFLPPDLTRDENAKMRFVHEAQAASALQHENICAIHDIDETPDGRMFIAMDCYDGETLKDRIGAGPLQTSETVNIAMQIASGLSKAHGAGMVHRDIKPANIMVTKAGVVKILDFGLAKLAGQTKMTRTGATLGTVAYMSPEQASGAELDTRSDIFALGSVLYEMLAGKVPFPGEHEAAVLYGIINCEPEPLTARRSDLPPEMQRIVEKALQKDPNRRYQTAEDFRHDLALFSQAADSPRTAELAVAVIDFRDLVTPDDPTVSAAITSLVHVGLVEASPVRVVSPSYLYDLRRRLFGSGRGPIGEDQVLELARKSGAQFALSGQLTRIMGGQCLLWEIVDTRDGRSLGAKRAEGADLAQIADRVIADVLPLLSRQSGVQTVRPPSVVQISTNSEEAYRHFTAGMLARELLHPAEALKHLQEAVRVDPSFALAFLELSRLCLGTPSVSEEAQALTFADRAWQLRARLGIKDRMRLEVQKSLLQDRVLEVFTTYHEMLDRWPDDRGILVEFAEHLYWYWYGEEGASLTKHGLVLYPDDLDLGGGYAVFLLMVGRLEEALQAARATAQRHPDSPWAWSCLGNLFLCLGLPDSAEEAFRHAFPLGFDPCDTLECTARCAYSRGDLNLAVETYERILATDGLLPGPRIQFLGPYPTYLGLAGVLAEAGRLSEATRAFEKAKPYVSNDPRREAVFENGYNRLLLRMGRDEEVVSWVRRLGPVSGSRRQSSWYAATAFIRLGSLSQARSALSDLEVMDKEGHRKARYMIAHVRAQTALAQGKPEEALAALAEMGRYGAHWDIWFFILWKETTARAYRMAGLLEEAANAHRELLRVCGGHALSHYELGTIYEEMKRPAEAKKEYAKFLEMWSQADEGLPQLADARKRLAAL